MKKFFAEFKSFIAKGNIVDLAVAVIIGGAFNKIVSSLVNDIIMPLISLMVGGKDVTDWKWIIREAQYDANGSVVVAESALKYGMFIQTVIDFLIIAITVFLIVKIFKASRQKIQEISETIITETKKFTKKQIKALKKLQKKGIVDSKLDIQNQTVENTEPLSAQQPNNKADDKKVVEKKPIEAPQPTTSVEEKNKTNLYDTELLYVLKEIRDTLKTNQNTQSNKN